MIQVYGLEATISAEEIFAIRLSAISTAIEDTFARGQNALRIRSSVGASQVDRCPSQDLNNTRPRVLDDEKSYAPVNRYNGMMDTHTLMVQRYRR